MQANSEYYAQPANAPEQSATSAAHLLINLLDLGEIESVKKAFSRESATFVHVSLVGKPGFTVKVWNDLCYAEVFRGLLNENDFKPDAVGITDTFEGMWRLRGFDTLEIRKAS